jgi:hypothetical protein
MDRYQVRRHLFATTYWGIYDTFANAFVRLPNGRDSWLDRDDCHSWIKTEQLNERDN